MWISKPCFIICCCLAIVNSIRIYEECRLNSKSESKLFGSKILITAWIDEPSEWREDLEISYSFFGKESHEYNDLIYVGLEEAKIYKRREGKEEETVVKFEKPVESGWQEFEFEVTSSEVKLSYRSMEMFSTSIKYAIETLDVATNHVAVNCPYSELWWLVGDKESTNIPLTLDVGDQEIAFYSQKEIQPTLTLPNSNDFVTLGWEDGVIVKYDVVNDHQRNLPATIKHTILISCQYMYMNNQSEDVACALEGKENIITFYVREMPKGLHVSSGNGEQFLVLLQMHSSQEQVPSVALPHSESNVPSKNCIENDTTVKTTQIIKHVLLCLMTVITTRLFLLLWKARKQIMKIKSKFDSSGSVPQSRNLDWKKNGSADSFIGAQGEETKNSNFNETKICLAESGSPWENKNAETIKLNSEVRKPQYSTRPVKFGDKKELQPSNVNLDRNRQHHTKGVLNSKSTGGGKERVLSYEKNVKIY